MKNKKSEMKQVFGVKNRAGRSYWTAVGVAYLNQDGSWNIRLDYIPTDFNTTTLQLRDFRAPDTRADHDDADHDSDTALN